MKIDKIGKSADTSSGCLSRSVWNQSAIGQGLRQSITKREVSKETWCGLLVG